MFIKNTSLQYKFKIQFNLKMNQKIIKFETLTTSDLQDLMGKVVVNQL